MKDIYFHAFLSLSESDKFSASAGNHPSRVQLYIPRDIQRNIKQHQDTCSNGQCVCKGRYAAPDFGKLERENMGSPLLAGSDSLMGN